MHNVYNNGNKILKYVKTFLDSKTSGTNSDKLLIMLHYLHFKAPESIALVELWTGRMQELISPVSNFYNKCWKIASLSVIT